MIMEHWGGGYWYLIVCLLVYLFIMLDHAAAQHMYGQEHNLEESVLSTVGIELKSLGLVASASPHGVRSI